MPQRAGLQIGNRFSVAFVLPQRNTKTPYGEMRAGGSLNATWPPAGRLGFASSLGTKAKVSSKSWRLSLDVDLHLLQPEIQRHH